MDFIWHRVSEKEKEEIRKQAKEIMNDFSGKLSKISKNISEPLIERLEGERQEGKGKCNEIDREIMFENAREKNKDFIIGEKKKW